jgi:hypothetical protein
MSPKYARIVAPALFALVSSLAGGCAVSEEDVEDGMNDDFLTDGKADGAITEGSPEALGVLRAANDATFEELDDAARMSSRTVANIVDHRDGADDVDGTADDQRFATLGQLDAVSYVGPAALEQLLAYARVRDWVPAIDPIPTCGGAPAVPTTGRLYLTGGTKSSFARDCDAFGACTAWQSAGADQPLTIDPYTPPLSYVDTGRLAWLYNFATRRDVSPSTIYEEIEAFLVTSNCSQTPNGYVTLDASGRAGGWMHSRSRVYQGGWYTDWSDCNTPVRAVTVQLGSTCLAITDDEPTTRYGHQVRSVVRLTW